MTVKVKDNSLRYQIGCIWEASSRKVGNVYPGMPFADVEFTDFLISAARSAWIFDYAPGSSVGLIVSHAVAETWSDARSNTNLGIILLIAPLAVADNPLDFRATLRAVLAKLTREDARMAYEAIRLANPGGLGDAPEQDVRSEPTVTLLEAMKLAADRDLIARQYANGFADVFDFGVPAFLDGLERFGCVEAAIIHSQLRWLAEYPDSLIARKNGPAVAEDVRCRAAEVLRLGGLSTTEGRAAGVALDRHLRSDGNKLNPGTTADLIAACLFVALRENKVSPAAPFRWNVPDWL
ncbi:MAG TPA: triphosphoribosyl-dephospho-CoA synthase [Fimbriiglobus sp.]|nr:triphosphoribosyl-dephospho-CoA synthase [Fimbriiglobus sp.]